MRNGVLHYCFCLFAILASFGHARSEGLRRIYAAGSGLDMLSLPETVKEIIGLSGKSTPRVMYLGTATYDEPGAQKTQTQGFVDAGCTVTPLQVTVGSNSNKTLEAAFLDADVIVVSGGNTLYAVNRWVSLGIDVVIKKAMSRGVVLCGGSAGGIVWFDGGHSDSMDATTYKNPPGPLLNPAMTKEEMSNWAYIRVPGLSIVPVLFCPHYDMTESNGLLRANDFTGMLQRHSGENGIGVDNFGALIIEGDNYTVISRKGKPGSVSPSSQFDPLRKGVPGAWKLQIDANGLLQRELAPSHGKLSDLVGSKRYEVSDPQLEVAAKQNPADGRPPAWTASDSNVLLAVV